MFNGCHNYLGGANIITESEIRIYKIQHVVNYGTERSLISLFSFQSIKIKGKFSIQIMRAYDTVVADACECGNEPSGSVKCGKFLD